MINYKNLPIGISDFATIVEKKNTLIDKTLLIKEVMDDGANVILFSRPRRFGKTLAITMIGEFLKLDGKAVFGGLHISKDLEFCQKHQNQYPVISMSFKDCKGLVFDDVFTHLKKVFSLCYQAHSYLLESPEMSSFEKERFELVLRMEIDNPAQLSEALFDLIRYIHAHTNKKVVVLIDEYDSPIHSAYSNGFYIKIVDFMRSVLGSALKDNPFLAKAVLTGIARVAKESMFSGLNNLKCYTLLDPGYAQYFGFTQNEVESLINEKDLIEPIKKWYNGYKIGEYQIYNPWSIIYCLSNNMIMDPYWVNTSDNALVYDMIGNSGPEFKIKVQNLIKGIPQEQVILDHLTFNDLNNETAIWTLLFHAGYLNISSRTRDEYGKQITFIEIPNREVLWLYTDIVEKWFYLNGADQYYRNFIRSLDGDDPSKFFKLVASYIASSMSYFDLNQKTPEHVFHIFMMGLLVGFRGKYNVDSNGEAGDGRYDVIMTPKDPKDKAIIMEFKVCQDPQNLQKMADTALAQITDKRYTDAFQGNTLALGMAFCGKQMIGSYRVFFQLK